MSPIHVLEDGLTRADPFLEVDDIQELLAGDADSAQVVPRSGVVGYPTRPLYRELGSQLDQWMNTGHCPVLDLPACNLLDERDYVSNRVILIADISPNISPDISPKLERLKSLWTEWTTDERLYSLREILMLLTKRGLLDLLGMRKTVGTVDVWPPPRQVIENTFKQPHKAGASQLTVGARALAKHCHRDETSSWWGISTGTEEAKNSHAWTTLQSILDNAHWINIHQLPHDVKIIEARQGDGYGARWTSDGLNFRGFLEPQMEDGHDVGWRH